MTAHTSSVPLDIPMNETPMDWETAFIKQYQEASIGRMFQGILHNLNGVNQAFSLQAALLHSTFLKADGLLQQMQIGENTAVSAAVRELQELLQQRAEMTKQIAEKIEEGRATLKRTLPLSDLHDHCNDPLVSINRIIQYESTILTGIPFFKHSVKKDLNLAENIPPVSRGITEIHLAIHAILENAIEALYNAETPKLSVSSRLKAESIIVEIHNFSPADPVLTDDIFHPFVSRKEGHLGTGLYIAKKLLTNIHGAIRYFWREPMTCFQISLPIENLSPQLNL